MGVHKRNIPFFCLLLYNDFFLCVIQHEMFIFRTTLVNTVIVIILSTNVIQFYCVTAGVVSSFTLHSRCCFSQMSGEIYTWGRFTLPHSFIRPLCLLKPLRWSIQLKGTASDADQTPGLVPCLLPRPAERVAASDIRLITSAIIPSVCCLCWL